MSFGPPEPGEPGELVHVVFWKKSGVHVVLGSRGSRGFQTAEGQEQRGGEEREERGRAKGKGRRQRKEGRERERGEETTGTTTGTQTTELKTT